MNFQHPARNRTPAIAMRAASRRARVFGQPLVDLAFKDYSAVGKAIEFGINVHQGQEWGLANQIVMLTTCLAIIVASISAVVMWWERRPKGKIGVPPYPADSKVYWSLWVVAIAVGVALPITGIAIIVLISFDLLVIRTIPPLRRAFADSRSSVESTKGAGARPGRTVDSEDPRRRCPPPRDV